MRVSDVGYAPLLYVDILPGAAFRPGKNDPTLSFLTDFFVVFMVLPLAEHLMLKSVVFLNHNSGISL